MIYFTSDTHYGHSNVIQYSNRPFKDVFHMHEEMIRRWNEVVGENDTVYHLGDFSLNKKWVPIILQRLNGKKILVPGNHDVCFFKKNKIQFYLDSGFSEVLEPQVYVDMNGYLILLSHLPYCGDHSVDERYKEFRPNDEGAWLFCGHVHEKWRTKDKQINVGVDQWDYYPVSFDTLLPLMSAYYLNIFRLE